MRPHRLLMPGSKTDRVNAIIPPLALQGPSITIRKFAKNHLSAKDLVGFGSVSQSMVAFSSSA